MIPANKKIIKERINKLYLLPLILFNITFSCSTFKPTTVPSNRAYSSEKVDSLYLKIQSLGLEYTGKTNIPGVAVAVIRDGKIAWTQCIGYADVETKKPITTHTIFNVGSVSKVVSAWGFMQLVEKGLVKLDEPVNSYLTRWKLPPSSYDISKVTLRRMLSHTAGLSVHGYGGSEQGAKLLSLEESLLGKTKRSKESVSVIIAPGTKWKYSGGGYTLAQLLLEEITKENFAKYMKENVFKSLGLNHTNYEWTEEMNANSATAYDTLRNPIKNRIFTEQAAAGLQTTILDMAHWAELSITANPKQLNKVLKPETIKLMEQLVNTTSNDGQHGLGYRIFNWDGIQTVGHTGENDGWCASVFLHIPTKSGLVILCNGSNWKDDLRNPIYSVWAKSVLMQKAENTEGK
ncbi:D-alanyl-D-alanine carboxypeptidase precursor [Sphingobacterium spiritivorum]|uniref:D-alanyl-D-alanine carboxypeptidase n=1 Tax=Sphingobacterium spiritivorum TaxID=258 RepID=A0A380CIE1_SPHSI|nr:serine hydrolase domain-containing protein [Sphingobacterium spiritivorum]SUJ21122.1 D-alanyl-D-alanine carboxypeptidase precursor [Sphingobacterium spiritivorum]